MESSTSIARDDSANIQKNKPSTFNILSNDFDPDGDFIKVDGIVQPDSGKVFDNGNGTVTYVPDYDFVGTDSFKYWTTDRYGNFSPAKVTIVVR